MTLARMLALAATALAAMALAGGLSLQVPSEASPEPGPLTLGGFILAALPVGGLAALALFLRRARRWGARR